MTVLDASKSLLVRGTPGTTYGVTAETIPGTKIAMQVFDIRSGSVVTPGNDIGAEAAGYVVSGIARIFSGSGLTNSTNVKAGDFYFAPAGLQHIIRNVDDGPLRILVAYSIDPSVIGQRDYPQNRDDLDLRVVHAPQDLSKTAQTRGMRRAPAISAETVGAKQIWMCYLAVNPHERGQAHHHGRAHTAAYTISGKARIYFGPEFQEYIEPGPGDFAFDPPGLLHLVDHSDDSEPWKGVLARTPDNIVVNHVE